jgi:hypothetical protein
MNIEDYRPNSKLSKAKAAEKEERKPLEKVVKGDVKVKKASTVRKFTDIFVQEDVNNVKSYILMDVLVPAAKKAISDIVTNGIDMILYGETGRSKKRSNSDRVSYSRYYDDDRRERSYGGSRTRNGYTYDDVIFETRAEAEEVLLRLEEAAKEYGQVSVADLFDLAGITGSYTDNKYGWTNLRNAYVDRDRDGWRLSMPKAMPLH